MSGLSVPARSATLPKGLVLLVLLLPLPLFTSTRIEYVLALAMIYAIAAVGLDVFSGYGGVLSIGHFGFVGIGAYASGILVESYGWSVWATLPASILISGAAGLVIGAVIVRLKNFGAALATFFLGFVIFVLIEDTFSFWTHSASGLPIEPLKMGDLDLNHGPGLYYLAWVGLAIVVIVSARYVNTRSGKTLRIVKRSDIIAGTMGVNSYSARLQAFVFSVLPAGFAGWIFAQAVGYLSPGSFSSAESIFLLAMAVVGGLGSIAGPILGAVIFELTSYLSSGAGAQREVLFGLILLVFLVLFPSGVYGLLERLGELIGLRKRLDPLVARISRNTGAGSVVAPPTVDRGEGRRASIEIRDVSVRFGAVSALESVDMSVEPGEIHAVMGPNGAGKTTLLNAVSGIQRFTGEILIDGVAVRGGKPRSVRRSGATRTFQHPALVPDLTVLENVEAGAFATAPSNPYGDLIPTPRGRTRQRESRAAALWALSVLGVPDEKHSRLASDLSLADQKLVDVARAIAGSPRLLMMDEPTAGLEESEMHHLEEAIRRMHDAMPITIIVIAHHVGFLRRLATTATVMDFGTVIATGSPDEVLSRPDVSEAFLGANDAE